MSTKEEISSILEDTAELLKKTQINLKKCPKQRLTKGYLHTRIQSIEENWSTFKRAHIELVKMTPREQRGVLPYFLNEEYYVHEELYLGMVADLRDMLSKFEAAPSDGSKTVSHDVSMSAEKQVQVKLPRIELPAFSGSYEEWPTYKDLFTSLVHNNSSLSNVQKLHYLKTSITGEAAALLKHIQITDVNYTQAWETLQRRYGNRRLIVNSLLKRLFAQKKCSAQTAPQLKSLLDTTNEILNSLRNLDISTDSWDPLIIFLVAQKLDPESHKEWEEYAFAENKEELSKWEDLNNFLESKFRTLELVTPSASKNVKERVFHVTTSTPTSEKERCCIMCKENHALCRCKAFTKMQPSERSQYVQSNKLCFNCLAPGHSVFRCRVPTSCRVCRRRHHSLLHQQNSIEKSTVTQLEPTQPSTSAQPDVEDKAVLTAMASPKEEDERHISLLATAVVILKGNHGHTTVLKALIDSGSQACFISEKAAQALKLERKQVNLIVTGMESMKVQVKQEVQVDVLSRWEADFELPIHAYVMSKHLTTNLPSKLKPVSEWPHLENINLADPKFYVSGTMDLLLGVNEYSKILQQGLIKGPPGTPCAQRTSLGWIVMGGINMKVNTPKKSLTAMTDEVNVEELIKTIWEIDTDIHRIPTREEQLCEDLYEKTHSRNKEGRYIVRLPFKNENIQSSNGNTREIAVRRLKQLERRFSRNKELKEEYIKVINEYIELGHLEEVPEKEMKNKSVYLPHHAVIRQDKETTKTRVVFDASCKGSNGVSLNDELLPGPVLQDDLRNIIMRWRTHAVCFVSDIQKMYRMILMHEDDVDLQRIVWRTVESDEIKDYRLLTVTFGTASAPYLAVKTLKQLAEDEGANFPAAARILTEDFYIDDCMSGSSSASEAIKVSQDLKELLRRGGFELKKWCSNNAEFMQSLHPSERSTRAHLDIKVDGVIKALGINWNLGNDQFAYNLNLPAVTTITKRTILADIQKLFDPLGWIAPCIVLAKILIQKLWLEKVTWDEELNASLKDEWMMIRSDLENVNEIYMNRWIGTLDSNKDSLQIHGFSDASVKAYAAVVYCRVIDEDNSIKTILLAAKTRVAPLKTVSLPRLELCGALILSRLLKQVATAMKVPASQVFAWTDSSIVLSWLFGEPAKWKPFVANRVVEITSNVNSSQWYHVQSSDNPADIASRGMLVSNLKKCDIWWKGPEWLSEREINFTRIEIKPTHLEKKKSTVQSLVVTETKEEQKLSDKFENFNTLKELLRTIVYCKRFLKYREKNEEDKEGVDLSIKTVELEEALNICIKTVQEEEFKKELCLLKKEKHVQGSSKLKSLNPYLDEKGILRVGGRLFHAKLEEDSKHPIIIGKDNKLAPLIIAEAHSKTLHGGIQLTLSYIRSKYWILRAKDIVKKHIHRCFVCAKQNAKAKTQIMGHLPPVRVTPARPFSNSGVDFAGPYQVLITKGRGAKTSKAYIAIFVCMSTRAIHLELVGDMTSQAFIGAFKRFCARRGRCTHLWSDQGRNFVGANKELADAWKEAGLKFDGNISDTMANDGTQWHFIPAYSPTFGGLWEAGVKSIKYHIKRILTTNLTFEEMSTLLCEIEACLNSRPLCPINSTDENIQILTPGHFLIGEAPITVPSSDMKEVKISYLTRWQYCQKLLNDFWARWQSEYLTRLQQRPKWIKREDEFKVGDVVLIKQDNLPPGKWALGRITEKHPGADGLTRVYSVKSGNNVTRRSVTKLCAMPIESDCD